MSAPQLSVQSLNGLFQHFQHIPNTVFWIRDPSYARQVYLTPNFQDLWDAPVDQLYDHPESWIDFLVMDEEKKIVRQVQERVTNTAVDNVFYFRNKKKNGPLGHVKDTAYQLVDLEGNALGYAGFAETLSDTQWYYEAQGGRQMIERANQDICRQVLTSLQQDFGMVAQPMKAGLKPQPYHKVRLKNEKQDFVTITDREQEVLWHLLSGLTAKQTARNMVISPRTVEFHLNNLKEKSNSKNKLGLISRAVLK